MSVVGNEGKIGFLDAVWHTRNDVQQDKLDFECH
jgi:hypothetical protein